MSERLSAEELAEAARLYSRGCGTAEDELIWRLLAHIDALTKQVEAADALESALQVFWDTGNDNSTNDLDGWWARHDAAIESLLTAQDAYRATEPETDG